VIVATDIAARGIDVKGLSHVINFDIPNEPETYVHRVGRTGRAGASGVALSLCSADERGFLSAIERLTRQRLERLETPDGLVADTSEARGPAPRRSQGGGNRASARPSHGGGNRSGARPSYGGDNRPGARPTRSRRPRAGGRSGASRPR
jgi:ATP-dependent RNA helicase RhlE